MPRNCSTYSASGYNPLVYRAFIDTPSLGMLSDTRSRSDRELKVSPK